MGALNYIGVRHIGLSNDRASLKKATHLLLPGVGAFAEAMCNIHTNYLHKHLYELVMEREKPILGICLGMQVMCLSGTENGVTPGLGFIQGEITKFDNQHVKVPHVGFDQVWIQSETKLYEGMQGQLDFYFTHSYKLDNKDIGNAKTCQYGGDFVASYEVNNIAGVQFHPELSQSHGLKLLSNFIKNF